MKGVTALALGAVLAAFATAWPHPAASQPFLTLEWEWDWQNAVQPQSNQVMSAPAVVDLNQDGVPDIVFPTANGYEWPWLLRAIRGDDGASLFDVVSADIGLHGSPAVGDMDGDGLPEIVVAGQTSGRVVAFENNGDLKWVSSPVPEVWGPTVCIANLDTSGLPEVIYGRMVLEAVDGSIRWEGDYGWGFNGIVGPISCVADLDLQAPSELIAGNTAYRHDGQVFWQKADPAGPNFVAPPLSDGFASVANFDSDPYPEIVLVTYGDVHLLEHDGQLTWSHLSFPGGGWYGGPATIEDFDGDGEPEIGVAGRFNYCVLETDGSLKWTQPITDHSSGTASSSVFDFNGDGSMEVVYQDEHHLWAFGASDGVLLDFTANSSATVDEFPVIADVDSDGQAEIVVCANNRFWGDNAGIRVFGSALGDWVNARRIWNQHTYHITNVNDDATIPVVETNNWEIYNNFRCQASVGPELASISGGKFYDTDVDGVWDAGEVGLEGWLILLESGRKEGSYPHIGVVSEVDDKPRSSFSGRAHSHPVRQGVYSLSVDSTYTDTGGYYGFIDLEPGTYRVKEVIPEPQPVWVPTTPTEYSVTVESGQNVTGVDFGNVALGEVGARTIGYWKNHLERITPGMYAALEVLPVFAGCGSPDSVLAILTPPWPNMAAKLRAQLLAMTLNVLSGIVAEDAVVYLGWDVLAAELLFGLPAPSFKRVQEVLDAVELAWDWGGWTRSEQEAVKDLLDRMNNDLLFVLPGPPGGNSLPPGTDGGSCVGGRYEVLPVVGFRLFQNVPNPFSSSTVITYQLPTSASASLKVYDIAGRLVRTLVDEEKRRGLHFVEWDGRAADGRRVPDGIYFYRMEVSGRVFTGKAVVVR